MNFICRTDDEIGEQLSRATKGLDHGTRYPALSFEDGATQMLDWLTGMTDEPPFPEP